MHWCDEMLGNNLYVFFTLCLMLVICMYHRPWDCDRHMSPDIDAATKMLEEEKVWDLIKPYIDSYSEEQCETRPPSPTTSFSQKHSRKRTRSMKDKGEL